MPRGARAKEPATDYHSKPVLAARVRADIKTWARDEAKRRGQGVGDFLEDVLSAERDRMANHVVNHSPVVAAEDEQPQPARNCKHRNFRGVKGVCPDCHQSVGYK